MNLLLLPRSALSPNGEVVVSGRQATHMKEVLKAVVCVFHVKIQFCILNDLRRSGQRFAWASTIRA